MSTTACVDEALEAVFEKKGYGKKKREEIQKRFDAAKAEGIC